MKLEKSPIELNPDDDLAESMGRMNLVQQALMVILWII